MVNGRSVRRYITANRLLMSEYSITSVFEMSAPQDMAAILKTTAP
jgi:hypothetical protein